MIIDINGELTEVPDLVIDPVAVRLEMANEIWEHIKALRDKKLISGFKVGTKWFHSDNFSRTQMLGLIMMGSRITSGLQWKTMDGSFVEMTPTLAAQVGGAAMMSG